MNSLNKTLFEAMTNNINKVIEGFNSGATITVFKGNRTIVLSSKVHTESTLMYYLNGATTVRICTQEQ